MERTLDGVRLKLIRAEEHLRLLDKNIGEYFDSNQPEIVKEADGEFVSFVLNVREQPSPYLGTIIGDCLHNMRSALDHLLWQLLCDPLPSDVRAAKLTFPVFIKDVVYRNAINSNGLSRCVSPAALALIERLQPYHLGDQANRHALWIIHELSNRDKHHMICTTVGAAFCDEVVLTGNMNPAFFSGIINPAVLNHGAELFRVPIATGESDRMNVNARFRFFVAISEADPWGDDGINSYLDRCLRFLKRDLIPAFEPIFS